MKNQNNKRHTYKHLLGKIQAFNKTIEINSSFVGTIILSLISMASLLASAFEKKNIIVSLVVAIASLISTVFCLIYQVYQYHIKNTCFYLADNKEYKKEILDSAKADSMKQKQKTVYVELGGSALLRFPDVDTMLSDPTRNIIIKKGKKYRLPLDVRPFVPAAIKKRLDGGSVVFNEKKVRLSTSLLQSTTEVKLSKTDYYSSLATNEVCLDRIRTTNSVSTKFDGGILLSDDNHSVFSLEQSPCSNHIGVSTLAFSNDGYCILSVQGKKNLSQPNSLIASGSGSINYRDLKHCHCLNELLRKSMERELREELNLPHNSCLKTIVVGYCRILNRGGKPEFFGITNVDMSKKEIEDSHKTNKEIDEELMNRPIFFQFKDLETLFSSFSNIQNEKPVAQLLIYREIAQSEQSQQIISAFLKR